MDHAPHNAKDFTDEASIDRSVLSADALSDLQACEFRAIAPGQRTATRHIIGPDDSPDHKPFTAYEITSELEGKHFSVGYAYRPGDAKLLAACRRLFEIAVYIVDAYKGVSLDAIENPQTRELLRRARAASMSVEQLIIVDCDTMHRHAEGGD